MWTWLDQHGAAVDSVLSAATLIVWVLYFQLLLNSYRHRSRPKILINRAGGDTLDTHCIITNMSAEAIYLETVLLHVVGDNDDQTFALSEVGAGNSSGSSAQKWYQGPLASGELSDIGSYTSIIERFRKGELRKIGNADFGPIRSLTVIAVASYTARDRLIAAERTFDFIEEETILRPRRYAATQIRSGRKRRQIEEFMVTNTAGKMPRCNISGSSC
ncbi:MAG: hypothetical protein ABGX47_10900 [Martelella sp.]|uniref:hypothetical protein n=1 Tax=Martelella sp. TaxID=1969699 RepID=UPI00324294D1